MVSVLAMADAPDGMTIDELAAAARLPTRTIRFYQARGALQRPEIRGRVAYYGQPHLDRLKLIAQLQDRGLRIDAIRDLVGSIDRGELDLAQWLGVERQVQASWNEDQPRTIDETELYAMAGSKRAGLIADLARAGLVERRGEVFLVLSPTLLQIAMRLEAAGIPLDTAAEAADVIEKYMHRAVKDLIELFVKRFRDGTVELSDPDTLFPALRPLGIEGVKLLFAREMDRELRKLLESGGLRALPTKSSRKRR